MSESDDVVRVDPVVDNDQNNNTNANTTNANTTITTTTTGGDDAIERKVCGAMVWVLSKSWCTIYDLGKKCFHCNLVFECYKSQKRKWDILYNANLIVLCC